MAHFSLFVGLSRLSTSQAAIKVMGPWVAVV